MAFKFESLQVWQKALDLTEEINNLTKIFPKDELSFLSSPIKRTVDSVVLNIAEGCTGQSSAVVKLCINYTLRCGIEVGSCLFVGKKRDITNDQKFRKWYD